MNKSKTLATCLTLVFTAVTSAQAQITCSQCKAFMPVAVPAGTAVICEPYFDTNTLTAAPASAAKTTVLALSCGIADGEQATGTRFEAALIGIQNDSPGQTQTEWTQFSFPHAVEPAGIKRVTYGMNDREVFESREWFNGKLRLSLKQDVVAMPKRKDTER